jgi:hypothetical protein
VRLSWSNRVPEGRVERTTGQDCLIAVPGARLNISAALKREPVVFLARPKKTDGAKARSADAGRGQDLTDP